ncbi:MAG: MMPL family transporter [Isosphaeraceae bacterium]|nr:MMPL family transporter [Isosphaeraceae bacterium]
MIRLLLRARHVSFAAAVLLLVGLLIDGRHVQYEQSVTSFFAEDDPDVIAYQRASKLFGSDNFIFIAYDDPALLTPAGMDRVAELAAAVAPDQIPAVIRVESLDRMPLFWKIDDRLIDIERLPAFLRAGAVRAAKALVKSPGKAGESLFLGGAIRAAKDRPQELAEIKAKATRHPLFRGTVLNASGTTTAVVVRLKGMAEQDIKQTVAALRSAADAFAARHKLKRPALVGPPVLLADGFSAIEVDGRRLALVGMLLIGLVTLSATQSLWWAIVPLLAGWVVWRAAETIMAWLDLRLSLSGGPLVAQIIVLTMPAASHLAIHFRDDLRREPDRRAAARMTLEAVMTPILWCAVTGALGYGVLLTSNVVPVLQFGAVLAVCTLLASILTMVISPWAMLPPFPLEIPVRPGSTSQVAEGLNRLTVRVVRHPGAIVLGIFAVVVPLALGIGRLRYESNYINAFKPGTRILQDYQFVESRLGGIGLVTLVVPTEKALDLGTLDRFRALDERIAALRTDGEPAVAHVISLATVLDPDGRLAALPKEKGEHALATKLELIAASPQADLLNSFWNREASKARVLVRVREQQSASVKEDTFGRALALARDPQAFGPTTYLTGLSYLLTQTTRGVIQTQWSTFTWAVISILAMLTIAFRSPLLAVLAMLPTLLAVGLVLGLMGWLGIKLDLATALVASVALGLSVDDTFHCLLQFRRHRLSEPFSDSLFASYAVTGPGVLLSSLAVAIGFAVLRFSEFVPFSNFGLMVGIATLGSSLGNLVLLPACLMLGHRLGLRFVRRPAPQPAEV